MVTFFTKKNCPSGKILALFVADPEASTGYKDDKDVAKDSITPTYALAVLHIHNERWEGVPFFLRCGKGPFGFNCVQNFISKQNHLQG